MSGSESEVGWILAAGGAVLLFLLATTLSAVLVASSSLSRVALHRLGSGPGSRLDFVETLREPASVYHIAVQLTKNTCLLGAALLLVVLPFWVGRRQLRSRTPAI